MILTTTLLERFYAALDAQQMPIATVLAPGLSDAEIDELTAPLGIALPDELRLLWKWHDGVNAPPPPRDANYGLGPDRWFAPLSKMVEACITWREIAAEVSETMQTWEPTWFPVVLGGVTPAADTAVAPDEPTPIHMVDPHLSRWPREPDLPSLGALIEIWTIALEERVIRREPDSGRLWIDDPSDGTRWPRGLP